MQGTRNRQKSVSFKSESENNNSNDNRQRSSFRDREEFNQRELDDARLVKLLPDANMTISVHNDFRDSCLRGNRSILKSNNFRDDTNLNYNNDRNNHPSNRGYESFRARGGRGKSRGFFQGNYDNNKEINSQRGGRGRPVSGNYGDYSYEKGQDYSNRGGRGRQSSESQEHEYDRGQEMHYRGGRGRQSQRSYNADQSGNRDQPQVSGESQGNIRGRSKSANDRPRYYRGKGYRGRGRGKAANGTDATVSGDGDKSNSDPVNDAEVNKEGGEQLCESHQSQNKDEEVVVTESVTPASENSEIKVNSDNEHHQEESAPAETEQPESVDDKPAQVNATEVPAVSDPISTTTTAATDDQ